MKIIYLISLFTFSVSIVYSQEFLWASQHNYWDSGGEVVEMATDKEGSVFSVGTSYPGSVRGNISKIDINGNLLWEHNLYAQKNGYSRNVYARALKTDNEGNCISGFTFSDTLYLAEHTFTSDNQSSSLIIKLDKNGKLLWHFIVKGFGVRSIIVNKNDEVIVSGGISYYAIFPDTVLQSQKNSSNCIFKLDKNGNYQLAIPSTFIFLNGDENNYSGYLTFSDSIMFNNKIFYQEDDLERGRLLFATDNYFKVKWAKQFFVDTRWPFSLMGSSTDVFGNIYLSGHHNGNIYYESDTLLKYSFQNNRQEIFLSKFDSLGNLIWTKSGQSAGTIYSLGIASDTAGNVFITGSFTRSMTLDDISLNDYGTARKTFIAKYDIVGNLIWLTKVEGSGESIGNAMAADNAGNVFFGGKFGGELIFGSQSLFGDGTFVGKIKWEELPTSVQKPVKNEEGSMLIYPNPSSNYINFRFIPSRLSDNAAFYIYNASGALVHSANFSANGEYFKTIDISRYSTGIYFMNVICGEESRVKKFIINR